jgi:hypothetical protein
MRTVNGNRIESLLNGHWGEENAISAPDIGLALGLPEREVRKIIATEFREWIAGRGLAIGLSGVGFFFMTDAEQAMRKQLSLLSLELEAKCKRRDFQNGMRLAGLGGLVTDKIPETFANASQPNQMEDRKRA